VHLCLSGPQVSGHLDYQASIFGSCVVKMATKRKHTCVPLKAKLHIIDRVMKGESYSNLASE